MMTKVNSKDPTRLGKPLVDHMHPSNSVRVWLMKIKKGLSCEIDLSYCMLESPWKTKVTEHIIDFEAVISHCPVM